MEIGSALLKSSIAKCSRSYHFVKFWHLSWFTVKWLLGFAKRIKKGQSPWLDRVPPSTTGGALRSVLWIGTPSASTSSPTSITRLLSLLVDVSYQFLQWWSMKCSWAYDLLNLLIARVLKSWKYIPLPPGRIRRISLSNASRPQRQE